MSLLQWCWLFFEMCVRPTQCFCAEQPRFSEANRKTTLTYLYRVMLGSAGSHLAAIRSCRIAALKAQVRRSADLELDEVTLRNALKFLAQHGSINSQKILNSTNKSN